jgi:hypothetical protein
MPASHLEMVSNIHEYKDPNTSNDRCLIGYYKVLNFSPVALLAEANGF